MTRRRFYGMAVFLVIALAIAAVGSARGIEQRLLLEGQAAIAQANIPYYDLEMRGRDAVVGGFIAEGTDVAALTAALEQVEGIRDVRVEGVVGRFADQGADPDVSRESPRVGGATSSEAERTRPRGQRGNIEAELRIHGAGCAVRIDGRVPANGFAAQLQDAFAEAEPCGPVEASLWANDAVRAAPWTADPTVLVTITGALRGTYRVTAYGSSLRVFGTPRDEGAMDRIQDAAASLAGVDFRFVTPQPESAGGAP